VLVRNIYIKLSVMIMPPWLCPQPQCDINGEPHESKFEFNVWETLKDISHNVPIRNLIWETYYNSHHVILCALHEQAVRANLIAELENVVTRGLQERTAFENMLASYQNKIDFIRQHNMEGGPDHQVSKSDFSLIEIRIICFFPAFLKESYVLCIYTATWNVYLTAY
jgi:hypothetical protein